MACKKCGAKAAKSAFVPPQPTTYTFDTLYPQYGKIEMTNISAREALVVKLNNNTLYLGAGQLTAVPSEIVNRLVGVHAPIWIF